MLLIYPAKFICWDKKMGNPRWHGTGPTLRRLCTAIKSVRCFSSFDYNGEAARAARRGSIAPFLSGPVSNAGGHHAAAAPGGRDGPIRRIPAAARRSSARRPARRFARQASSPDRMVPSHRDRVVCPACAMHGYGRAAMIAGMEAGPGGPPGARLAAVAGAAPRRRCPPRGMPEPGAAGIRARRPVAQALS